jgi:hypothetical protein
MKNSTSNLQLEKFQNDYHESLFTNNWSRIHSLFSTQKKYILNLKTKKTLCIS